MKNCPKFCNGETGRSLIEWFNENIRKDIDSHIFKDSIEAKSCSQLFAVVTAIGSLRRKYQNLY